MYTIVSDSCANLTDEIINKYGIEIVPLFFIIDGKEYASYAKDKPTDLQKYYDMLTDKTVITTSCVAAASIIETVEPLLKAGSDILYLSFTSQLSSSFSVAEKTLSELRVKYPGRRIFVSDTLSGAMGQGLIAYNAARKKEAGEDIESVFRWIEENKANVCHIFTLETLSYLFRGGRIKKVSYFVASTLNIKPILQVDETGKIVSGGKTLGKRAALSAIIKKYEDLAVDPERETLFIGHANNIEDAEFLKKSILEKIKVKEVIIHHIDMVLGAHLGPGGLGLFFLGKHR